MPEKRSILALDLPGIKPGVPPTRTPEVTWIDPTELLVDESYQRGVGEKGMKLIRRIVETFDWRRFKPPTAVWTDQGLEVVDGQHSAIAAASHPAIKTIPVLVVEGADVRDRASTFVGINRDRLNVTMMQMHAAGLVAGDAGAMQVDAVCQAAGIRILKSSPSNGDYRPRDTVAVSRDHRSRQAPRSRRRHRRPQDPGKRRAGTRHVRRDPRRRLPAARQGACRHLRALRSDEGDRRARRRFGS